MVKILHIFCKISNGDITYLEFLDKINSFTDASKIYPLYLDYSLISDLY